MKALLLFHGKAGVRVAVRSFAILFSALLAWIMLDMNPAGVVNSAATAVYARGASASDLAPCILLAFLFPYVAAPTLRHGLSGWMRHLSFSSAANRRGMAAALFMVQIPLCIVLALLAPVAHQRGLAIGFPALRWLSFLAAGALAALPVKRRILTVAAALIAVPVAARGGWGSILLGFVLLLGAEEASGPLHEMRRRRPWRAVDSLLSFRIGWRALGWRVPVFYGFALLPLAASSLFLKNNELNAEPAAAAVRLGAAMAAVLVLAGMVNKLAERRPAWPLARSFPSSSSQRVAADAAFLGVHALLPVLIAAVRFPGSAAGVLGLLPFLSLRAAGYIRLIPGLLAGARRFLVEGFCIAAILALFPWVSLICLVAAPLAFIAARKNERALKVTRWSDLHHAALGDPLSWSE
jgi:hypothetical protein